MRQAPSGQRINTDSCSFAALIGSGLSPNRILDVGAGTGVVALMLAKRFANAEIVAVFIRVNFPLKRVQPKPLGNFNKLLKFPV